MVSSNGDVRKSGRLLGKIETDGDVRKDGRLIGKGAGIDRRHLAVLMFTDLIPWK